MRKEEQEEMYQVLIVDDTEVVRLELKRLKIWEKYGFEIKGEAKNGLDAIKKLQKETFDFVLTDIQMPVRNGLELLEEIKGKKLCGCTALLSAHNDFTYAKKGMGLGAFDYLLKPIDEVELGELLQKVRAFLDQRKEEAERESNLRESLDVKLDQEFLKTAVRELTTEILDKTETLPACIEEVSEAIFSACGGKGDLSAAVLNHFIEELIEELKKKLPWLEQLLGEVFLQSLRVTQKDQAGQKSWVLERGMSLSERIFGYTFGAENETLRKLCQYVLAHVDEELTVKQVAEKLSFNRDYLSRFFKEQTGQTMTDYINRVKTDRARVLLESGNFKIYEVSEKLGYKAVEHFSRLFRQYQGVYPKNILRGED